ncbi:MAG: glycosyltransferase family 2 protein, partial [Bacteroidales bacterium]|nr:glycosyltransferase family 2 protein [Bacteroidales bacterium]
MNSSTPIISVVSPVYKGEKMVGELVRRNVEVLTKMTDNYEIILVNDASPDDSWNEIVKQCEQNYKVKGINLSRNFGQHYAITAGLAYAKGKWVVVMDCDLQNNPEDIPNLYNKAMEGYDIVYASRVEKHFGWWKKKTSEWYHRVFNWLSDRHTDESVAEFGIYSQQVITEYNKMPEYNRYFSALIDYLGFRIGVVDVAHADRMEGESSYTMGKLVKLALDSIISSSNKPLRMAVQMGFLISLLSFLLAL